MPESRECPQCGRELPPDAPAGLCPECLLRGGDSDEDISPTTPQPAGFVPPEPQELASYFPQLEILELLGKGGMGAVYKARQPHLDRLVALKILPLEIGQDPAFTERFTREARALAKLSHPNIVGVYDFGEVRASAVLTPGGESGQENASEPRSAGGEPVLYYFLMEYIEGTNLRQLIARGGLKPDEALAVVPQICEALQFAHDEGIVHRDIKPENVLVDTKGRVKIADFGLAKLLVQAPAGLSLTATRQVMGTWHYMAPEQMRGSGAVDHRADIYSLGVVFYEMLTGEVPAGRFDPPSRKVQLDVRLDEVVLKALEQEPERRYQAASEVKTKVETISRTAPPTAASQESQVFAEDESARLESARRQVRGPANGLLAVGVLNCLMPCLTLVAFASAESPADFASGGSGGSHSVAGPGMAEIVLLAFIWLPVTVLVLLGAVKMKSLQAYGLAVTAAVLAMLPCTPSFFIGLPVGIWALIVLTRPDVKAAFAATAGVGKKTEEVSGSSGERQARSVIKGPAVGLLSIGLLECALMVVLVCGGLVTGYSMTRQRAIEVEQMRQEQEAHQKALRKARQAREQQRRADGTRLRELQSQSSVPSAGGSRPENEDATSRSNGTNHTADAEAASGHATSTAPTAVVVLPLALLLAGLFLCRVVTIICAVRLMRGESYGAGVVGSILALIPCSPLWIASLPVGIWGLVVLGRDDVKRAFRGTSGRKVPEERQSPQIRSQARPAREADSRISESPSRADEAAAAVRAMPSQRAAMPLLLLIAVFLVLSALTIAAGAALGVYAFLTEPAGSDAFWGWMGGAFGCLIGGAGSLVGCWNSYRQMEGAGDILREPGWTWLDALLLVYGIGGAAVVTAALVGWGRLSEATIHSGLTLGGLMLGQALLFAVVRGLARRSVGLEAHAAGQGQLPAGNVAADSGNEFPSREARFSDASPPGRTSGDAPPHERPPLPGISTILDRQVEAAADMVRTPSFWRTVVKAVLVVVYVLGLLAFFGWQGAGRAEEFRHEIGFPTPWFVVEKDAGGVRWEITLESWAWLVAGAAFAAYYFYWQIKLAEGTASRGLNHPAAHVLLWLVLAFVAIAVAMAPVWVAVYPPTGSVQDPLPRHWR